MDTDYACNRQVGPGRSLKPSRVAMWRCVFVMALQPTERWSRLMVRQSRQHGGLSPNRDMAYSEWTRSCATGNRLPLPGLYALLLARADARGL